MRKLGILLMFLGLAGCSGTISAKVDAYGVHAITPYGIMSLGYIHYERQAEPEQK